MNDCFFFFFFIPKIFLGLRLLSIQIATMVIHLQFFSINIQGPGAGKGTQCANLVRDYGFVHLSGKVILSLSPLFIGFFYLNLMSSG